jgi:hypothetical protein
MIQEGGDANVDLQELINMQKQQVIQNASRGIPGGP